MTTTASLPVAVDAMDEGAETSPIIATPALQPPSHSAAVANLDDGGDVEAESTASGEAPAQPTQTSVALVASEVITGDKPPGLDEDADEDADDAAAEKCVKCVPHTPHFIHISPPPLPHYGHKIFKPAWALLICPHFSL
jgi:hypothetical protein